MSKTEDLRKLINSRQALEKKIKVAQRALKAEGIAQVKSAMSGSGLTLADLSAAPAPTHKVGKPATPAARTLGKVAPKYRNAATGETWTGRGLKPRWLTAALTAGRSMAEFTL